MVSIEWYANGSLNDQFVVDLFLVKKRRFSLE